MGIDIRFEGDRFSPKKLKKTSHLPIEVLDEYGEIATSGRYKGKPSPYGMGLLDISTKDKNKNIDELIEKYVIILMSLKKQLIKCGVDEIIFDIEISHKFPLELSLNHDIIKNISNLNARIDFYAINSENKSRAYLRRLSENKKLHAEHSLRRKKVLK